MSGYFINARRLVNAALATVAANLAAAVNAVYAAFAASGGAALIGFIQYGVGAILRTIQDKFREDISVLDFETGADDTQRLQAAMTAAAGKRLIIPGGFYTISAPIVGVSSIRVAGHGQDCVTIKPLVDMDCIFDFGDCSNYEITGITFDGDNKTKSNVRSYAATAPKNVRIHGCGFTGTKDDPTLTYGCIEFSQAGGRTENVRIDGNLFYECGTHGAIMAYVDRLRFTGNTLKNIGQHGMEAVGCFNVIESENTVDNCGTVGPGGSGLGVGARTTYWKISNNVIVNCKGDAPITCEFTSNYGIIDGNVIKLSNANAGISVAYGDAGDGNAAPFDTVRNVSVVNNCIENSVSGPFAATAIGINMYSGLQGVGCEIRGNTIRGFNVGIVASYLKGARITNNEASGFSGALSAFIKTLWVTQSVIDANVTAELTTDHTIQLLNYSSNYSDDMLVINNITHVSGATGDKSVVYIEGDGAHTISGNRTRTAKSYVEATGAAVLTIKNNNGPTVSAPWIGATATVLAASGNYNGLEDFAVVGGCRVFGKNAVPVAGTYAYNDRIINTNCSVGQPKGWVCTVGGSPGTWVSEGNL